MRMYLLATDGVTPRILRNYLHEHGYGDVEAILERPVSRKAMLAFRRRKLGTLTTLGQVAFMVLALPLLRWRAATRRTQILETHGLRDDAPEGTEIRVATINAPQVGETLADRQPDAVLVNGTRIIREHILAAADCPYINTHAGITPQYRGVHGGYWALRQGDDENFGVTIHLVDTGVDTGNVLRHIRPAVHQDDTFVTYPLVQQAAALPELLEVLREAASGTLAVSPEDADAPSRQWYHPTLLQYLAGRVKGVK